MDKETTKKKLILAVLQGDDYADTVDELNRGGFFATVDVYKRQTLVCGVSFLSEAVGVSAIAHNKTTEF